VSSVALAGASANALTSRKSDGGHPPFDCGQGRLPAYDVVLKGTELGSGSSRIHRQDIQSIIFKALGMSPEEHQGDTTGNGLLAR